MRARSACSRGISRPARAVAVFALAHASPQHAGPALLAAALLSQFVVDFAVSTVLLSVERGAPAASQLGDCWVYGVDAALSCAGLVVATQIHRSPVAVLALLPLLGLLSVFARERHQHLQRLLELNNAYRGTALVLGDVVEADDGYTGDHCKSVVQLCLEDAVTQAGPRPAEQTALASVPASPPAPA